MDNFHRMPFSKCQIIALLILNDIIPAIFVLGENVIVVDIAEVRQLVDHTGVGFINRRKWSQGGRF